MHLEKLSLVNFKNYPEAQLSFENGAHSFVGNNGEGKTNLLDAIHYLSLCKSYFNMSDLQNIRHHEDFFVIHGVFRLNENEENISCGLKRGQRKVFRRNQKEYERLADHIGLLPVVMISPVDSVLITEGSEERRKFMDSIIAQYDKIYLDDLINYNKVISQRNALLKHFAQMRRFDSDSLHTWDAQMVKLAENIFEKRKQFISLFLPIFKKHYQFISNAKEEVELSYESHLSAGNFSDTLASALDKDRIVQYTTVGTHKDEIQFMIGGYPVKRFASQGQQKSFLISLKLAQFDFIKDMTGMKPILLLDDIFDKLDDHRVKRLMELVNMKNFGQLFITDTHPERVKSIFDEMNLAIKIFKVENGVVQSA